jgi:Tol biopolymer transport system component
MNDSAERLLATWLSDGPDTGPREGLDRALAATRRTRQRPGWTFLERWIPMQLTMRAAVVPRSLLLLLTLALLVLTVLAAVLLAGAGRARPAPPFGPAANGLIAYDSEGAIVLANADGSAPRTLAIGLGQSYTPTYSPDGMRMAFLSRAGNGQPISLWTANADGTNAKNITPGLALATEIWASPSWSPDSTRLTFHSSVDAVDQIVVANADGTGARTITDRGASRAWPDWSPTGEWILFRKSEAADGRGPALGLVRPDGTEERELVALGYPSNAGLSGSRWSPHGDRIAYWAGRDGAHDIFVVDLGGRITPVSAEAESEYNVNWSPSGDRLVFEADASGVVVAAVDGSRRQALGTVSDCGVMFSPDGKSLLGFVPGTECRQMQVIPLGGPASARPVGGQGEIAGTPSWQRRAP